MDIRTHDFMNDEEFQKFFRQKRKGKYLIYSKYLTLLEWCKREWVSLHNSPYKQRSALDRI